MSATKKTHVPEVHVPKAAACVIGRDFHSAAKKQLKHTPALAKALESERPILHNIEITLKEPEWLKGEQAAT
jgi:hypothetical protein